MQPICWQLQEDKGSPNTDWVRARRYAAPRHACAVLLAISQHVHSFLDC